MTGGAAVPPESVFNIVMRENRAGRSLMRAIAPIERADWTWRGLEV